VSNLASILESRLSSQRLRWLRALAEASRNRATGIYIVGGVVRDLLLDRPIVDMDISVSGLDEQLASDMADALDGRVTSHSQFNTFKIEIDSTVIDVAMTRQESYANPGALPEVLPGSLEQDLARRDFSVNAMAVDISSDAWGELLDPFNGQGDLNRSFIRVLHPKSFSDDATRIFRAVRYSQRLGFALQDETAMLLQNSLGRLDAISGDRMRHEFQKVFAEACAGPILSRLDELGVLGVVFGPLGRHSSLPWPDWQASEGFSENPPNPEELVWLSTLACGLTPGEAGLFARRLNMDSNWSTVVRDTVAVEGLLDELCSHGILRSRIYQMLNQLHPAALRGVAATHDGSAASGNIHLYLQELQGMRTELTGRDLMALGIDEGPEIGRLLNALLEARLDGSIADRLSEEALLRRMIS